MLADEAGRDGVDELNAVEDVVSAHGYGPDGRHTVTVAIWDSAFGLRFLAPRNDEAPWLLVDLLNLCESGMPEIGRQLLGG